MNSQHKNINSKGDFVIKILFCYICFKDYWYTKINFNRKYVYVYWNKKLVTPNISYMDVYIFKVQNYVL